MNTKGHPWIQRTAANAIYEKAATVMAPPLCIVQAPAGTGKTLLAVTLAPDWQSNGLRILATWKGGMVRDSGYL